MKASKSIHLRAVLIMVILLLLSAGMAFAENATFTYDSLNRLISATYGSSHIDYTYDSAGNITNAVTPYTLSVTKAGAGDGIITSDLSGIDCGSDCVGVYSLNNAVTLTSSPSLGSTFTGWSDPSCPGTGTCTIATDGAKSVTATFTIASYAVTPSAGTGGSISPSTAQTVNYGSTTAFTVTPDTGYHIDTVSGCGGGLVSNTYTTGAISGDCTVSATFVNNAPVADDQSKSTDEDTAVGITLTGSDVDGDPLTYAVISSPSNGTLSGTAPNLTYTPNANFNGTDTFTFKANDGIVDSNIATVTITVNAVNDAPVADAGENQSASEGSTVSVSGSITDPDTGETHTISWNFGDGTPATTGTLTPTHVYADSGTYTVTLTITDSSGVTGTDTLWITVINVAPTVNAGSDLTANRGDTVNLNATFNDKGTLDTHIATIDWGDGTGTEAGNVTESPFGPPGSTGGTDGTVSGSHNYADSGVYVVTVCVTDDDGASSCDSLNSTVVNGAPVAVGDSATTSEDSAITTGNVLTNDTDAEGDVLSVTAFTQASSGTVVDNLNGTFTYTPNGNFNGTDSFTYTVSDGNGGTDIGTVSITVTPINDAPVANDQSVSTNEDTAVSITLTGSDVDGDALTYTIVTNSANGTLSGTAPDLTYTPNTDFNGTDSFTFKTNDGALDSNIATVTVTISAINDAPDASSGTLVTDEDTNTSSVLPATDVEGDTLTFSIVSNGTLGVATITDAVTGAYSYAPNANANGTDTFTFKANDGVLDSNIATVTVTINAVNDAPVSSDGTLITNEDTAGSGTLSATDVDGDGLALSVVTNGTLGVATITDAVTGAYSYVPNADANGTDTFTFKANDGTVDSNTATITVTVSAVNDAPVAADDSASISEDNPVTTSNVLSNDTDVDGDVLSVTAFNQASNGTVVNNMNGTFTYTPNADSNGTDSFTYTVSDGNGGTDVGTVSITVTAVNDAPVVNDGSMSTNEDTAVGITLMGSDVDGDALTYTVVTNPANGTLSGTVPNLIYMPNTNFNGTDTFTFKANDGALDSNIATMTVTVGVANDPPDASDGTLMTRKDSVAAGTLSASDADGDPLTFSVVANGLNGTAIITNATTGTYAYTPSANFSGTDTFTFRANDGILYSNIATVTVTVIDIGCDDAGTIQCLERTDGGNESDNLDTSNSNPKVDIEYRFKLTIKEPSGSAPQHVKLNMAQRSAPVPGDFHAYDMSCSLTWITGATCTYATKLGPAAVHKFYFELETSNGTVLRYPETGYITGPSVQLATGYNVVGAPRDINTANLDGQTAFGSSKVYRWISDSSYAYGGYYLPVTGAAPAVAGEGYVSLNESATLPGLEAYGEMPAPDYTYELQSGWNLISNPYAGNVKLSDIKVRKGIETPISWAEAIVNGWVINAIYYFNGEDWGSTYSFESAGGTPEATLIPWMGYWMKLNMSDDIYYLVIPKP